MEDKPKKQYRDLIKGMVEKAMELQPLEAAMFDAQYLRQVQHLASHHAKNKFPDDAKFTSVRKGDTVYLLRIK